jgi:hypothetical protein
VPAVIDHLAEVIGGPTEGMPAVPLSQLKSTFKEQPGTFDVRCR